VTAAKKKKGKKKKTKKKKEEKNLPACDTVPRLADHRLLAAWQLRISFCFFLSFLFSLFSFFIENLSARVSKWRSRCAPRVSRALKLQARRNDGTLSPSSPLFYAPFTTGVPSAIPS